MRLNVPSPHLPFRRGANVPTPSGKIEIESPPVAALGLDPLPSYIPPYESEERAPELARRFPLALISPPAHRSSTRRFVNVASLRRSAGKPTLEIHADDAATRGIADGAARAHLQRPRRVHRRSRHHRSRAPGRRLRAVGLVGEADRRRHERQPDDLAGADRPRRAARRSTTTWSRSRPRKRLTYSRDALSSHEESGRCRRDRRPAKLLKTRAEYSSVAWHVARTSAGSSRGNHAQVHTPSSCSNRGRRAAFVCARPQPLLHHL